MVRKSKSKVAAEDKVSAAEFHVLAVDDSSIDRKLIERLLKTSSYKVTSVDSALRALEILGLTEEHSPLPPQPFEINLIITDYCMPAMTGYDLLKRVKETSALKEIPVVIMSSENVTSRIEDCKAEGAEDFILKPVQLEDVKKLRGFITGSRGRALSLPKASSSGQSCPKRKMSSPEVAGRQVQDSDRRSRINRLAVA